MNEEINIFKALDYLRDHAAMYAEAKANRVYLDEYRKSKKAMLMQQAELEGAKSVASQEVVAYAHPEYITLLEGLKEAVEAEEKLRWLIVAAQARVEVWRSLSANQRFESKTLGA